LPILDNIEYGGKVNRFVRHRVTRRDDSYVTMYVMDKYGMLTREKWSEYDLIQTNAAAEIPQILKYNKVTYGLDGDVLTIASTWCEKHFHCSINSVELEGDDYIFNLMEKNASVGYPFNLLEHKKKKTAILDKEIRRICFDYNDRIEKEPTAVFWAVHEKEEIRDSMKVALNRLRVFVGSGIDFLFASICMFFDMNERMYSAAANFQNWSYVGATQFYGGWHRLYKRLKKHPNAFELDETDYDCSISRILLTCIRDLRKRFLHADPVQQQKIDNLYIEIIYSIMVLAYGEILVKEGGNPSGSFNTITDNSLVLYVLLAYAWIILAPQSMRTYEQFHAHVEAVLCGDDNTWTVSNEAVVFFNAQSVAFIWTNLGITTKSDCWEARKLEDCNFVSNAFHMVKHPLTGLDWCVPRPSYEKIMASLAYHSKGNVRWTLLRAAALRIQSYFNLQCRVQLLDVIDYLQKNYLLELQMPCNVDDPQDFLSYEDVMSVLKTDVEIEMLYFGDVVEGVVWNSQACRVLSYVGLTLKGLPYKK